jgi:toxin ParE1/3/4
MGAFRLSPAAQADLANILDVSAERWGSAGRRRYAAILAASMRGIAARPNDPMTRNRAELAPGLRSYHVRYARAEAVRQKVKRPVHVLYFRIVETGLIEIARVLHERMEPSRHFGGITEEPD